ncbi:hypothetical protein ABPG74_012312 [Tetrahymena malaccensis]
MKLNFSKIIMEGNIQQQIYHNKIFINQFESKNLFDKDYQQQQNQNIANRKEVKNKLINQTKVSSKKSSIQYIKSPQITPKSSVAQLKQETEIKSEMQVQFCQKKEHHQNPINLVCLSEECEFKGLLCSFCLIEKHSQHVNECVPLKKVLQALNKVNNPNTKEELGFIGCDILKQHYFLFSQFRRYITAIQDSIKSLEQAIEKKMLELRQESELFVGNLLEQSMEKLNDPNCNAETIQQELKKLFPLLQISPIQGEVQCLGVEQKQKEAERITKSAELLERECKFWMEKSLEDLKKLENNILIATRRRPISKISQSRFGKSQSGWVLSETEALTFEINKEQDIWLKGFGMFEVTSLPKDITNDRENNGSLNIDVKLFQGGNTQGKVLHEEIIHISRDLHANFDHIIEINLQKPLKLETKQKYTITLKPNRECISYFGYNGCFQTSDFKYYDSVVSKDLKNNSSGVLLGQFPVFYYEE